MPNLYKITAKSTETNRFTNGELVSVTYHDIFDFPLTVQEMIKWRADDDLTTEVSQLSIIGRDGFYFLEGKEGIIYKRTLRKRISERKMVIARKAAKILSLVPLIKMVAVTGSLAMENAGDDGDIDLMVVTESGKLWTGRLISHLLLRALGQKVRRAGEKEQKDKLCLNIWMDEKELSWKKNRNIYTAHEIAQIVPLVNKDRTYEKLLDSNRWILDFWPYSVKINRQKKQKVNPGNKYDWFELLAYKIQYSHMKSKITREVITPTRALFHPQDWGKIVISRLAS